MFSIDFDVIYDYLNAGLSASGPSKSIAAIEALSNIPQLGDTLLRGTWYEFLAYCSRLFSDLPASKSLDELIGSLRKSIQRSQMAEKDFDEEVRLKLLGLFHLVSIGT